MVSERRVTSVWGTLRIHHVARLQLLSFMTSKYEHGSREWKEANKIEGDLEEDYAKQCGYSKKWLLIEEFSINPRTGTYFSVSDANKAASAATKAKHKKSPKGKISNMRYRSGETGKATERRYWSGEAGKAAQKRANIIYNDSVKGKVTIQRYKTSAAGKAASKRYNQSDGGKISKTIYKKSAKGKIANSIYKKSATGKATQKRSRESAAGKAQREREYAAKRLRTIEDRGWAMDNTVLSAANSLISGKIEASPTFLQRTGWHHVAFRKHMRQLVEAKGFDLKNHGNAPGQWNIEHRIPRSAYDFLDPEEIKRCWSTANLDVKSFEENEAKADALLPEEVKLVPERFWPKAWAGVMPDESKRLEIWKLASARKVAEAAMKDEDSDEDSDVDSDEDSDVESDLDSDEDSDDEPDQVATGAAGSSSMAAPESPDDSESE